MPKRWLIVLGAPGLIGILAFVIGPLVTLGWVSFTDMHSMSGDWTFVGMRNYGELFRTWDTWRSILITAGYTVSTVVLQLAFGSAAAVALRSVARGRAVWMTVLLLPYVLPTVVACAAWRWLLHEDLGPVPSVGRVLWAHPIGVFFVLVLVSVWAFFPFVWMLLYARLGSIPQVRYDTAAMDGLTQWQQLLRVSLPELRHAITSIIVLRSLWMWTKFDVVWLLVGNNAMGRDIRTVPVDVYTAAFEAQRAGQAAALSVSMVALLVLALAIYVGLSEASHGQT